MLTITWTKDRIRMAVGCYVAWWLWLSGWWWELVKW